MLGFPQRLENLQNESGDGKVMEHKKFPKVMEFCDRSWNFNNFAPQFYQMCAFFADIKKFVQNFESLQCLTLSAKCRECKFKQRDI